MIDPPKIEKLPVPPTMPLGFAAKPSRISLCALGVPYPIVTRPAATVVALGFGAKPSSTTYAIAPALKPSMTRWPTSAIYDARVIEVGFVASFNVNVAALVLPSSFFAVSVVLAIDRSIKNDMIKNSACAGVGATLSAL